MVAHSAIVNGTRSARVRGRTPCVAWYDTTAELTCRLCALACSHGFEQGLEQAENSDHPLAAKLTHRTRPTIRADQLRLKRRSAAFSSNLAIRRLAAGTGMHYQPPIEH